MKAASEHVRTVVQAVWSTQLGLEIRDADASVFEQAGETLTAAIHISGDDRGSIRLECTRPLIRRAAAIMFSLPENDLTTEDERDVIGELTNVIAGNLKSLLDGDNSLSLPTIIEGTDYQVSTTDVRDSEDYHFSLDGDHMVVTVVEHTS